MSTFPPSEFAGNVAFVETAPYWDELADAIFRKSYDMVKNKWANQEAKREFEKMGNQPGYLYLGSGKTIALIGQAFGEAMKTMCPSHPPCKDSP